jgi:hypothetical protein
MGGESPPKSIGEATELISFNTVGDSNWLINDLGKEDLTSWLNTLSLFLWSASTM